MSAGQIFTGSGVDSVIITGSLLGDATVRLDNSGSSEESADSITIANISSGVVYGESGADTFNISGDARKASIYGGAKRFSHYCKFPVFRLLEAGEGMTFSKLPMLFHPQSRVKQEMISSVQLVLSPQVSFMEMLVLTPLRSLVQSRARVSTAALVMTP